MARFASKHRAEVHVSGPVSGVQGFRSATFVQVAAVLSLLVAEVRSEPVRNPANGHYYEVVDDYVNWFEAKAKAEAGRYMGMAGHLVTVTSAEENLFLTETFGSEGLHYHWAGGVQAWGAVEPDGGWGWITGEAFSFDNWPKFEPNNMHGSTRNENRIVFDHLTTEYGKMWNDLNEDYVTEGYVVEYEPEADALDSESADTSAPSTFSPACGLGLAESLLLCCSTMLLFAQHRRFSTRTRRQ